MEKHGSGKAACSLLSLSDSPLFLAAHELKSKLPILHLELRRLAERPAAADRRSRLVSDFSAAKTATIA